MKQRCSVKYRAGRLGKSGIGVSVVIIGAALLFAPFVKDQICGLRLLKILNALCATDVDPLELLVPLSFDRGPFKSSFWTTILHRFRIIMCLAS